MEKAEKKEIIQDIKSKLKLSKGLFLFEYHGLNVSDMTTLRRKFQTEKSELKIYKNTLLKKALQDSEVDKNFLSEFKGPIACVFGYGDIVPAAKVLTDFEKEEQFLKIKSGLLGIQKLSFNEIKQLAKLPSKDVLVAQLVGTFAAPLKALVTVLSAVPRDFVYVLKAMEQKKSNS